VRKTEDTMSQIVELLVSLWWAGISSWEQAVDASSHAIYKAVPKIPGWLIKK